MGFENIKKKKLRIVANEADNGSKRKKINKRDFSIVYRDGLKKAVVRTKLGFARASNKSRYAKYMLT